ncbi:MAG: hypothetical protein AB1489_00780 [Acidobacteriota bacterium]
MMKKTIWTVIVLSTSLLLTGVYGYAQGRLLLTPDKKWTVEQSSSSMRVAQYLLPKHANDPEDASLIVYFFGGGGGSVQANLDRWIGQMAQPDGSASKDKAKVTNSTTNGLKITLLDVGGTYQAEVAPGAGTRHNKSNYRMLAAVIETPGGPYFIKLVGPAHTVEHWRRSFDTFMSTLQFK